MRLFEGDHQDRHGDPRPLRSEAVRIHGGGIAVPSAVPPLENITTGGNSVEDFASFVASGLQAAFPDGVRRCALAWAAVSALHARNRACSFRQGVAHDLLLLLAFS